MIVMNQDTPVFVRLNAAAEVVLFEYCRSIRRDDVSPDKDPNLSGGFTMPLWLVMRIFGPHMIAFAEPRLAVEMTALPLMHKPDLAPHMRAEF